MISKLHVAAAGVPIPLSGRMTAHERDDAIGLRIRKRLQENRVDHAENGRVGADAEREREQCGKREPRRVEQRTDAVSSILDECFDPGETALIAIRFFDLHHASEIPSCGAQRLIGGHSLTLVLLRRHLQMKAHLIVQLAVAAPLPEDSTNPGERRAHELLSVARSSVPIEPVVSDLSLSEPTCEPSS